MIRAALLVLALVQPAAAQNVARAQGALLRGLDKVSGRTTDIRLQVGEAKRYDRLQIRLGECRFPAGDPSSDAFAQLTITDLAQNVTLFSGPVRHPDVPEQIRFFAVNSQSPNVSHYLFTPTDWDTWRTFRIEAVDDDVDEWSYNGRFRSSEIGYKIDSEDYYYRNNGTSCLNERIG